MGQVQVSTTPHGSVQQSRNLPVKYVWSLRRFRHRTCLHRWPFSCYKRLLDRTSYFPRRDVTRLQKDVLKVNTSKSCFGAHRFDYLGYHVTCNGVMPIPKKVEAIRSLVFPKTHKQLRQFIGMINFYRDMWQKALWDSCPINCLNLQKRQMQLERQA